MDLCYAYHLVEIKLLDEWKTAFNTHLGHFEYLVIHPLFFQAMVNGVLRDCLNRFVFVLYCLDNILIFSKSLYEHESQICLVLQCLLENELFIKGENCEYHTDSISLFGYIVEWGQVRADLEKIQVVLDWATLTTWEHLQHFLGFANFYCQFICNFSKITLLSRSPTSPLLKLLSRGRTQEERSFPHSKTSASVLTQPDTSHQFIVEVDASDYRVKAVLS